MHLLMWISATSAGEVCPSSECPIQTITIFLCWDQTEVTIHLEKLVEGTDLRALQGGQCRGQISDICHGGVIPSSLSFSRGWMPVGCLIELQLLWRFPLCYQGCCELHPVFWTGVQLLQLLDVGLSFFLTKKSDLNRLATCKSVLPKITQMLTNLTTLPRNLNSLMLCYKTLPKRR